MTLQEALKRGLPFHRRSGGLIFQLYPTGKMEFSYEELVADDWAVQEPYIQVTRGQVEAAWRHIYGDELRALRTQFVDHLFSSSSTTRPT